MKLLHNGIKYSFYIQKEWKVQTFLRGMLDIGSQQLGIFWDNIYAFT